VKKKKTKPSYRLRNWQQYNNALVQRGSLTLWLSDEMMAHWLNPQKRGKPGRSNTYTDTAILCRATLQEVYHLRLRATQGLLLSLIKLLGLDLAVPDYSSVVGTHRGQGNVSGSYPTSM